MRATEPLPLHHSWPLCETSSRFARFIPTVADGLGVPADAEPDPLSLLSARLARQSAGIWSCDLATERLEWSRAVYELFGLPREERIERALVVTLYEPHSRRAMETLRAYAIRHHRGFTLDAQIRTTGGDRRWMRLSAVPVLQEGKVVKLTGVKQDVTAAYECRVKAL